LLGEGVNIAARLEGLAQVGGICVSRSVFEQVANKLSVHFADIGEQQVKNIPTPVHAFMVEMRHDNEPIKVAAQKKPGTVAAWAGPASIAALAGIALIVAAFSYFVVRGERRDAITTTSTVAAPSPAAVAQKPDPQRVRRESEALVPESVPFISDR